MHNRILSKTRPVFLLVLLAFLSACAERPAETPSLTLRPVSFGDLPGWDTDAVTSALPALRRSCARPRAVGMEAACAALQTVPPDNETAARHFLESWFQPFATDAEGLFTGYYEPELKGSLRREGPFQTPLWGKPRDMISADLGAFNPDWKGKKLTGKVVGSSFVPYDARADVAAGSLDGRAAPLVWVDDSVEAFILEIQGSGRVRLQDGTTIRIGYAAQNGQIYVPIGRSMAEDGLIARPVTMPKIRAWLNAHPEQAQSLMNRNPSVVFFRQMKGDGPVGAQGVALTPERSLAVDRSFIALGMPLWLVTQDADGLPVRRLVIAQDTGGAIRGPVRGDLFWGAGEKAEDQAGRMQSRGTYYVLKPREPRS